MSTLLNLKEIERKAFRSAYQDGLWDIYIGGIILSMALMLSPHEGELFLESRFGYYLLALLASSLIFWLGKRFVTVPRLGQVKFGPQRKRRSRTMAIILAGIVLLQAIFVIGTALLRSHPEWARQLGFGLSNLDYEHLLVSAIGALFVGPSMTLIAYFIDFPRGYYIAFMLSLAVFLLIWFGEPLYLVFVGLLVIVPGVVLLVRFLRQYPLRSSEVNHD